MKFLICVFVLGLFCFPAAAEQMKLDDLYKICTSSTEGDKVACRFYILGAFDGIQLAGAARLDNSRKDTFQEAKDKLFCVPDDLSSAAMEVMVKMRMAEDIVMFPDDRKMPAISFIIAVIYKQYPCGQTK